MSEISKFEEDWRKAIEEGSGTGVFTTVNVGVDTGYGKVRLSVSEDGEPRIMIPVAAPVPSKDYPQPEALKLFFDKFEIGGRVEDTFIVQLHARDLTSAFIHFSLNLIERIREGAAPLSAFRKSVSDFRELLESARKSLSREEFVGLVGELFLLDKLLDKSSDSWRAWEGVNKSRHDFWSGIRAIEVKTTTGNEPLEITINSVDQLDSSPAFEELYLFVVVIDLVNGGLFTLESLIESCEKKASDVSGFKNKLQKAIGGRSFSKDDLNRAFHVRDFRCYQVKEEFPRITSENFEANRLPDGITSIQYKVLLAGVENYRLTESRLEKLFTEIADV